jgi:hypothetical protein
VLLSCLDSLHIRDKDKDVREPEDSVLVPLF